MSNYIKTEDITDSVALGFVNNNDSRITKWLALVDNEINGLSDSLDVTRAEITATLHPVIKEYACSYFCFIIFRDNIGTNNVQTSLDEKYRVKYDLYKDICSSLRQRITPEMFTDTDGELDAAETAGQGITLWRG